MTFALVSMRTSFGEGRLYLEGDRLSVAIRELESLCDFAIERAWLVLASAVITQHGILTSEAQLGGQEFDGHVEMSIEGTG